MEDYLITEDRLAIFAAHLRAEERRPSTVEKYARDVRALARWLAGRAVTKAQLAEWKQQLVARGYAATTVNGMLAAVHAFFSCMGWMGLSLRYLRVQRRAFRENSRALSRADYAALLAAAKARSVRLALVMETICATGIRVSELPYMTVEAARAGRADISLKGKIRTILIPAKLCKKLRAYAKHKKITSGEIFLTRGGHSLSRKQIWAEMKRLCASAGVDPRKVFPHNLRHLFAVTYYKVTRDMAQLADLLGHSSIETTRLYLLAPASEQRQCLDRLRLVL
ncbi:MAG: tyrosine-type recombinase/integrase [Peptococcaceae bacterium]|nr:tyrosine-type recombinase/integrase [Peptococcaceae bacterium]